ncbi:major facilitator superfamily domain-containing protein [Zychaea mexicana]|uniref:major facilitator superfamily domain-containing protein n=1 Tax=Zychaea mexicana TaxID=64656 RepID=UPI0022FF008A|nr:major facilitator superfamily domain-containing protein [Zychaea mexicana]KAI9485083.1 major facilitator superfamily domain-containing protein [Zychaea mexicana]
MVVACPFLGYMGDRIPHRRYPMLLGMVALFGSIFFFLYGNQLWMFGVARCLQGFADACIWTLGLCFIVDTSPPQVLGAQLSKAVTFHTVGLASGAPIGGVLFHSYGYRAPFILCLIVTVIDLILRIFVIERRNCSAEWFEPSADSILQCGNNQGGNEAIVTTEAPRAFVAIEEEEHEEAQSRHSNILSATNSDSSRKGDETATINSEVITTTATENHLSSHISNNKNLSHLDVDATADTKEEILANEESPPVSRSFTVVQLMRYPRALVAMLTSFAFGIAFNVFEPTMPIRLASEWGYNSGQIGIVFLAQMIPSFVATPICGYAYDRFGPKWITSITMTLCGICTGLMGIPNHSTLGSIVPLIVLFALEGFFAAAFTVSAFPEIAHAVNSLTNSSKDGTASSYALLNVAFASGAITGPLLGGFLFDKVGFFWLCIIIACFLLLAAPFTFIFLGDEPTPVPKCISKLVFTT